jgi:hypothetical protein
MARTRRRHRAKLSSHRPAASQRSGRNEKFRRLNVFGNRQTALFIAILVIGYILIAQPKVEITLPPLAQYGLAASLSGAVVGGYQARRGRR